MAMEDLKKMKETMDSAMTDVQSSVLNATTQLNQGMAELGQEATASDNNNAFLPYWQPQQPEYKHPGKNWRLKRSAMPQWYKARQGVRTTAHVRPDSPALGSWTSRFAAAGAETDATAAEHCHQGCSGKRSPTRHCHSLRR